MMSVDPKSLRLEQPEFGQLDSTAAPLGSTCLELEVGQEVMGEHHELLPRAVRRVGLGRDAVEREPGLSIARWSSHGGPVRT